jgi:hypothetical protein
MAEDEEHRPVEKGAELGSLELENRVRKLQEAAGMIRMCLAKARPSATKPGGNPFFRTLAVQHYQSALTHLQKILSLPEVIFSDECVEIALVGVEPERKQDHPRGINGFLEICEQAREGNPRGGQTELNPEEDLRSELQSLADDFFSSERIESDGHPCAKYEELLAAYATIPEIVEEEAPAPEVQAANDPAPAAASPLPEEEAAPEAPAAEETGTLYERTFAYEGADKPPRKILGEMCLQVLRYTRGISEEEATSLINVETLMSFERRILKALGDYQGEVRFFIARSEAGELEVDLERRPAPAESTPAD